MSLQITCPHCGPRPIEEFAFGEIAATSAALVEPTARNIDKAFMHNNIEGVQAERWFHLFGCRRWLTLKRDTRTDEVVDEVISD